MEGLTVGRIVHWVCNRVVPPANNKGTHMAAIVTYVWDKERGLVNLFVPPDMHDETFALTPTSVLPNLDGTDLPGTWHWIEKA